MASTTIEFAISFSGEAADGHRIDFYDVSQALVGFQRSLALTTHLAVNGEIITQAPSLTGAHIIAFPPEEGSWKTAAAIVVTLLGGIYEFGTAPQDTPIGNLSRSLYDYVISHTLGFHVDYKSTLGQQIEQMKSEHPGVKKITPEKLDSLIEKCEIAITNMHRPISHSHTASSAIISTQIGDAERKVGPTLNLETYQYVQFTSREESPMELVGRISSYNMNTFKGRIFLDEESRPVPFELAATSRDSRTISAITESLSANASNGAGMIKVRAFREYNRTGRLKRLFVIEVFGRVT